MATQWTQPRILGRFLIFVYKSFMQHQGLETAKSLTYTSLFAVVPLFTLVVAILSVFPSFQVFGSQVQDMLFNRLLPSTSVEIEEYLSGFANQARNITWAGAVMLLVTAFLMLRNIERSFNQIWGVAEQRKGMASFLLYWCVLSLGPLLLGLGFAISSYITSLALFDQFTAVSDVIGARNLALQLFPLLLTTAAFTLLYAAVPNCGVQFRHALVGALVVALSFKVVKWVFTQFIASASYELIYGTFAAIPIFLMWIYLCWLVILFGANLVRGIPLFTVTANADQVHPTLLLLALIHRFWEKQQRGETLRLRELMEEQWPFRSIAVEHLLVVLEEQRLIRNLQDDEYFLIRDLEGVSLWQILSVTPWAQPGAEDLAAPVPPIIARHLPDSRVLAAHFQKVAEISGLEFSTTFGAWFRDENNWGHQPLRLDKRANLVLP